MRNQRMTARCSAIAAAVLVCSSGCGQDSRDKEITQLTKQVHELQSENAALRSSLFLAQAVEKQALTVVATQGISSRSAIDAAHSGSTATTATAPSATPATAIPATQLFSDLAGAPNQALIEALARTGIFNGLGKEFKPYKPISRGEYAAWLVNANNALQAQSKQIHFAPQLPPQFKDLPANHPFFKYVQALANAGWSVGYEDGTYRPDKAITREEMIGMKVPVDLGKVSEPQKSQMSFVWKFSDAKDVDNRFSGYIHDDFYISGPNGGNIKRAFGTLGALRPKQAVMRCEAAATLWQFGHGDWARTAGVSPVVSRGTS